MRFAPCEILTFVFSLFLIIGCHILYLKCLIDKVETWIDTYLSCIGKPVLYLLFREAALFAQYILLSMRRIRIIQMLMKPALENINRSFSKIRHPDVSSISDSSYLEGSLIIEDVFFFLIKLILTFITEDCIILCFFGFHALRKLKSIILPESNFLSKII